MHNRMKSILNSNSDTPQISYVALRNILNFNFDNLYYKVAIKRERE